MPRAQPRHLNRSPWEWSPGGSDLKSPQGIPIAAVWGPGRALGQPGLRITSEEGDHEGSIAVDMHLTSISTLGAALQ